MARTREEATSASTDSPASRGVRTAVTNAGVQKPVAAPRPRGRPKSDNPKVKVPSGRPRGRPRLDKPPKVPSGRPRGRPKGSFKKPEDKKTPAKPKSTGTGKRGRPRKLLGGEAAAMAQAAAAAKDSSAATGQKRGRGRPRKAPVDATAVAKAQTIEEALDAAAHAGVSSVAEVGSGYPEVENEVEDGDDSEDAEGEEDSDPGMADPSEGEGSGLQWMSKIKGYFG